MKKRTLLYFCFLLMALLSLQPLYAQKKPLQNDTYQVDQYLGKASKEGFNGMVLIAKKGKVIFAKGYGFANKEKKIAFDKNSVFDIGSITKQFTGAAILKLEMEGKLKTSDKMSKYLSDVPKHLQKITLHQLLTHTSGLYSGLLGSDQELIDAKMYRKKLFKKPLGNVGSYAYSNAGYTLLGMIIEKVSRMSYENYLHQVIFKPLGMTQTGYTIPKWKTENLAIGYKNNKRWGTSNKKSQYNKWVTYHLVGNGGIMSTVVDMHKWYKAIRDYTMLSAAATKKYIKKHVVDGEAYYGYGWAIEKTNNKREMINHNGSNGIFYSFMGYSLSEDFMIILINNNGTPPDEHAFQIDKILHGEFKILDQKLIDKYTGTYRLPSGVMFEARFNAQNQLTIPATKSALYGLFAGTPNDDAATAKKYNKMTYEVLDLLTKGKYKAAAKLEKIYMPEDNEKEIAKQEKRLFDRFKSNFGKIKSIEILGSVARQAGKYYLSYARLNFEKGTRYFYYYWKGNLISRRSPHSNLDRTFAYQKGKSFFAESNQLKIELTTKNGQPALHIGEDIVAKKTGVK